MDRAERLKAKLLDVDDRVVFLEREQIIHECAHKYADETAGVRFGHTLTELLSRISIPMDEDDLIAFEVCASGPGVAADPDCDGL